MEGDEKSKNGDATNNRFLRWLLSPFSTAARKVIWFISFVTLLALGKGLEPQIVIFVNYEVPIEIKVAQVQALWPDVLGDHRVPALFKLVFGRDRDTPSTPTETPRVVTATPVPATPTPRVVTATPVTATPTPRVVTATPVPATATPYIITATSLPPSDTPVVITATPETSTTTLVPTEAATATVTPTEPPNATFAPVPASPTPIIITATPETSTTTRALTETSTTSAPATPWTCHLAPPPQLKPGQSALQLGPNSLRLRQTPGLAGEDVNVRIMRGDRVEVQSEPRCVDGFFWYEVRTARNHIGWTVESGKETRTYYLAPLLTPRKACERKPRLIPGDTARAKTALKVRQAPRLEAPDIGLRIRKNDRVKVLAGPVCADAYIWYQVRNSRTGDTGWAVAGSEEGVHGDYWFYPPERE